jgi:pimeloyl-ACP methyl ester carboxylesterase
MGNYVQLGEVRTWYDERGRGEPLLLAHGGVSDARFFDKNIDALTEHYHVYTPERRGHGHTGDVEGPITYELMTDDTIAFLDEVVRGSAHLVGHSDGAVVAMMVAMQRPDLARDLVLVSGGFHRDGLLPAAAELDVNAVVEFVGDAYGEVSPDGKEHFRVVVEKIAAMAADEPDLKESDLADVKARTLVMFSDDDLVSMQHVIDMYEALPDAELAVVPGTSHFLLQEKPDLCNRLILEFLANEPVATVAPMRRARAGSDPLAS